jgi:hypothetical protein
MHVIAASTAVLLVGTYAVVHMIALLATSAATRHFQPGYSSAHSSGPVNALIAGLLLPALPFVDRTNNCRKLSESRHSPGGAEPRPEESLQISRSPAVGDGDLTLAPLMVVK